ncbi:MAG: 50S ribosomal protein L18 [Cyclobacteriaceae bacterium]|nr:50S ribosomal protein L18 [Cyclobacteriaceae bacterium]
MKITKSDRRLRIRRGIRTKIAGTSERPRLSVYKSNKAVYAQIIDDSKGHTLVSANSTEINSGSNVDASKQLGLKLAEKAKAAGVENVVFDRGGYQYHGKVKALAEGAREGGLKF